MKQAFGLITAAAAAHGQTHFLSPREGSEIVAPRGFGETRDARARGTATVASSASKVLGGDVLGGKVMGEFEVNI